VAVPWHVKAGKQRPNGFPEDDPARVAEVQGFYDRLPPLAHEGHRGQIANVLAAIAGEEPLWIDGLEGRKTLELITAIYQSAHLDQAVRLPLTGTAPCYTRAGLLRHARHFHEKTRNVDNFADNVITLGRNYEK